MDCNRVVRGVQNSKVNRFKTEVLSVFMGARFGADSGTEGQERWFLEDDSKRKGVLQV